MLKALHRRILFLLCLSLLCEILFLAFAREWIVDLLANFYLQRLAIEAVLIALWLFFPKPRWAWAVPSALLAVHVFLNFPWLEARRWGSDSKLGQEPLRLISFNVLSENKNKEGLAQWLAAEAKPNTLIFLIEVDQAWADALLPLKAKFPYGKAYPRGDNFGWAVLSTVPIEALGPKEFDSIGLTAATGKIRVGGRQVSFFGVHPFPPINPDGFSARNEYLQRLRAAALKEGSVVVMGDFNTTPLSAYFADFRGRGNEARLFSVNDNLLPAATWFGAGWPFAIPIDHIFLSAGVHSASFEVGPDLGSDHRPVRADILF